MRIEKIFSEFDGLKLEVAIKTPAEEPKGIIQFSHGMAEHKERYFDFMDLSMTDIHVQWTIPENKKNGVEMYEGATRVEMIDLSEPGKIKFAWPLNDSITKAAGSVDFSVRFSLADKVNPDKLYYSLNTTSATIIIKPAL